MTDEQIVLEVAHIVRETLLRLFPETPDLRYKCKYGAMLLDEAFHYLKKQGLIHFSFAPAAGFIHERGNHECGHVWMVVTLNRKTHILDVTLTQFASVLNKSIPPIVFGKKSDIEKTYPYKDDFRGKWKYDRKRDIKSSYIDDVLEQVKARFSLK